MNRSTSRRNLLGMAGAGALTLGLHRAGIAQTPEATPSTPVGTQPDGTWVYTDARGVTVTLPQAPTRIVADMNVTAALWDFGVRPVGVFGWNARVEEDGTVPTAGGNVDPTQVNFYSGDAGGSEHDLELMAADAPELLITYTYTPSDPELLWSIVPEDIERMEALAPIIAISAVDELSVQVANVAALAEALGADLATPEIEGIRQGIAAAEGRAAVLLAEKPNFSALWVSTNGDALWVANPKVASEVQYARKLGIHIPDLDVEPGAFWEQLSFEQALKYQTDVVYIAQRGDHTIESFTADPILGQIPAAQAGQILLWNQDEIASYQGQMAVLVELLTALEMFESSVVEEDWI